MYLHEVLDKWFETDVKPRLQGRAFLVRYADDFVIAFQHEADARRVMDVLPKRFGKYGLTLHPDKTRLVNFTRPRRDGSSDGEGPGSFDLLGFTHHWALSQKGNNVIRRKTMQSRFTRAIQRVREWCRIHRHLPIAEQCTVLGHKLRGHYGYYGSTGNYVALKRFADAVQCAWRRWLGRRSQRGRIPWDRFRLLLKHHVLPPPRAIHSVCATGSEPVD